MLLIYIQRWEFPLKRNRNDIPAATTKEARVTQGGLQCFALRHPLPVPFASSWCRRPTQFSLRPSTKTCERGFFLSTFHKHPFRVHFPHVIQDDFREGR